MISKEGIIKYLKELATRRKAKNDREIVQQALDDYRDSIPLPGCPVCGGKLVYVDKSMGSGVKCFGSLQTDGEEGYYEEKNGCGFHGFTLMRGNELILIQFKEHQND